MVLVQAIDVLCNVDGICGLTGYGDTFGGKEIFPFVGVVN